MSPQLASIGQESSGPRLAQEDQSAGALLPRQILHRKHRIHQGQGGGGVVFPAGQTFDSPERDRDRQRAFVRIVRPGDSVSDRRLQERVRHDQGAQKSINPAQIVPRLTQLLLQGTKNNQLLQKVFKSDSGSMHCQLPVNN